MATTNDGKRRYVLTVQGVVDTAFPRWLKTELQDFFEDYNADSVAEVRIDVLSVELMQ
jgi:hypothetical protein